MATDAVNQRSAKESKPNKRRRSNSGAAALVALAERVAAVLLVQPAAHDVEALRLLLGNPSPLRTQREVAIVFNQSTNTVAHSWRSNGMPGSPGNYDALAVLAWLLQRNQRNEAATAPANAYAVAMQEVELESARATLDLRRTKLQRERGLHIPLPIVESILGSLGNVMRDAFQSIPRQLTPMFPKRYARELTEEVERLIRNVLVLISEKPLDEFRQHVDRAAAENGRYQNANGSTVYEES